MKLTKSQLDIMKVFWETDEPLSVSDIIRINPELNINTVRAALNTMLKKNFIKVDDIVYSGTVLSRSYRPVITLEEYLADNFSGISKDSFTSAMVANFINNENDIAVIEEIESLLQKRKREIQGK